MTSDEEAQGRPAKRRKPPPAGWKKQGRKPPPDLSNRAEQNYFLTTDDASSENSVHNHNVGRFGCAHHPALGLGIQCVCAVSFVCVCDLEFFDTLVLYSITLSIESEMIDSIKLSNSKQPTQNAQKNPRIKCTFGIFFAHFWKNPIGFLSIFW